MTQATDVALPSDYDNIGLEDFDPNEASVPRIQILHPDGLFKDGQTGEQFPEIHGVFLGLVKQRVMWARVVEDDSKPLCKSNDAVTGYPNTTGPDHSLFPWHEAGLNMNSQERDPEDGRVIIKCETCPMTQWTRNGTKNTPPPCSERYTMPIHFATEEGAELDHAGIISFQKSSIGPVKAFVSAFSRAKMPLFSAAMSITLSTTKRGSVVYSVPKVQRRAAVPNDRWEEYARQYRDLREFLRMKPRGLDDEARGGPTTPAAQPAQSNAWGSGAQVVDAEVVAQPAPPLVGSGLIDAASTAMAAPVTPAQPMATAPAAAPVYVPSDDDLPF